MRVFAVLITASAVYLGAHDVAPAQQTVPNVAPPLTGLGSTPVTSTVTNCMMSCNSQAATCQTGCVISAAPTTAGTQTVTLNATRNTSCQIGCTSTQLTCHTACARLSSQIGQ